MEKLKTLLNNLDGKSYKGYSRIKGSYSFSSPFPLFTLFVDYVQADPFAPPSAVRVRVPQKVAKIPEELFKNKSRKTALEDYLIRTLRRRVKSIYHKTGTGKSGLIDITRPSQQIIERTAMDVNSEFIEARFFVGLPARGRRILGKQAYSMFFEDIPFIIRGSLLFENIPSSEIEVHVQTAEDADYIRQNLKSSGLVAFVANGSILPRESGISEKPLESAVKFNSPKSLEVEFDCPNRIVKGMGIPEGITLIVGGGYHGKSTLLNALAFGVYNHIPGDGREFVITSEDAVKIRAEDGRYVESVDISGFISDLPDGRDTKHFSTRNASGSTSQAANIMEALEMGSKLLLIDEDTSATNIMIRDRRMQELISKDKEPITPLIDMIKPLREHGVSIILIMGGLGDYFDVGDYVIAMEEYKPMDVTGKAKEIVEKYDAGRKMETPGELTVKKREINTSTLDASVRRGNKIKMKTSARGKDGLLFGNQNVDLSRVEQIVEQAQVEAIGNIMNYISRKYRQEPSKLSNNLGDILEEVDGIISSQGLISILPLRGSFARPRKFELAAAINRLRTLKCG